MVCDPNFFYMVKQEPNGRITSRPVTREELVDEAVRHK